MTARELIEKLQEMPPDAEVLHIWDGAARTGIENVWLSRDGRVMTADEDQVVYDTDQRPKDAPHEGQDPFWSTPELPPAPST